MKTFNIYEDSISLNFESVQGEESQVNFTATVNCIERDDPICLGYVKGTIAYLPDDIFGEKGKQPCKFSERLA